MTSPSCTGFQSLPNKVSQIVQIDELGQISIEDASGFAQHRRGRLVFPENLDDLSSPQKFGKGDRINCGVRFEGARGIEGDAAAGASGNNLDAPPIRNFCLSLLDMTLADHERRAVEDGAIDRNLVREPIQRVGVALDLIAVQITVDDGDIDAASPVAKAKLVEHQSVGVAVMLLQHLSVQCLPDVSIPHASPA